MQFASKSLKSMFLEWPWRSGGLRISCNHIFYCTIFLILEQCTIILYIIEKYLPSRLIPAAIHFLSLQYWHRLRLIRKMLHCWFLVQGLYWIFCWMDLLKNPWKMIKIKYIRTSIKEKYVTTTMHRRGCVIVTNHM